MSDTTLQLLAKASNLNDKNKTAEYTQQEWASEKLSFIEILKLDNFKALITYSNAQSSYKSQSRYGILYPFLRLFGFAEQFEMENGTVIPAIKFGERYSLADHDTRVTNFSSAKEFDFKQIQNQLYYNTFRCYTVSLNLQSWADNNQGARGFIDTDKLAALPKISTLISPIEALRAKLFTLADAVYSNVKSDTVIQIKIPKGYSILRRDTASYKAITILEMLRENCVTPITEESLSKQINKYIASYSNLIDSLIVTATTTLNSVKENINNVDECLRLIGVEGASLDSQKDKLKPKIEILNTEWDLPKDALTPDNLLKNFSQWRSRAVYNRTDILASIRLSMESHNKIIMETGTKKKLEIAKIGYYTSMITKSITTLGDSLKTFDPTAGALITTPLSTLATLAEQIIIASGKLNLERIEIASSHDKISKDEVKIIDDLWTSVLIDVERFIKEGVAYLAKPNAI